MSEPNILCSGASECPSCQKMFESTYRLFYHFYKKHMIKCRTCHLTGFDNVEEANRHHENIHTEPERHSQCPICSKMCRSEEEFTGHVFLNHQVRKEQGDAATVKCPPCNIELTCDGCRISAHLKQHMHSQITGIHQQPIETDTILKSSDSPPCSSPPKYDEIFGAAQCSSQHTQEDVATVENSGESHSISNKIKPPRFRVGDRVNAMWGLAKGQFFPATVVEVRSDVEKCIIRWDDGDTTGKIRCPFA